MKVRIKNMTDREKFLESAKTYIGKNGKFVCLEKLKIGFICDWCAFSVSAIMNDCGFIGKYIKAIEGGAGTIPRYSDGKYGEWFKKGTKSPQPGDLFFLRYNDYPYQDKYFCDHIGIVEEVNGNIITTLEGNVDGISGNWAATSTFKRKVRYLNNGTVYAFYRPFWKEEDKSVDEIAKEVIAGKWGAGDERKKKLTAAGYDYQAVQKRVNELIDGKKEVKKPIPSENEAVYQINTSQPVDYDVIVTAGNGVNIRCGASTNYKKIGAIPCGVKVHISKQTSGGGYTWGLTTYAREVGWIALEFTKKAPKKAVSELAYEVIAGKWGAGQEREKLLTEAGYNYDQVQKKVNEIMSKM